MVEALGLIPAAKTTMLKVSVIRLFCSSRYVMLRSCVIGIFHKSADHRTDETHPALFLGSLVVLVEILPVSPDIHEKDRRLD